VFALITCRIHIPISIWGNRQVRAVPNFSRNLSLGFYGIQNLQIKGNKTSSPNKIRKGLEHVLQEIMVNVKLFRLPSGPALNPDAHRFDFLYSLNLLRPYQGRGAGFWPEFRVDVTTLDYLKEFAEVMWSERKFVPGKI
jgi:hypothetical protein